MKEKEKDCLKHIHFIIEKTKIKKLNNINKLHELPFYDELNIVKTAKAFKIMQEIIALK